MNASCPHRGLRGDRAANAVAVPAAPWGPARRLVHAGFAAAIALAILLAAGTPPARAEFDHVEPPLVSRRIAYAPVTGGSPVAIGPTAVRSDGWLIVGAVDSELHLLPPSGGELSADNRFGPPDLRAFTMVMRRGFLYVLVRNHGQGCPIAVLDPDTGAQVRTIPWSQCDWPVATVDPVNDDLILQAFTRSACSPCALDGHGIVDFDPDAGTSTTIVKDPIGPYSEALAVSPDAQTIFVAEEPNAETTPRKDPTVYIDAYPRLAGAASVYRIPVPSNNSPDGMVYRGEAGCFGDALVFADDYGAVFAVPHPSPTSTTAVQLAWSVQPSTPDFANQSEMTLDRSGDAIVGSFNSAMVLACPAGAAPPPPPPPPPPAPRVVAAVKPPAPAPGPAPAPAPKTRPALAVSAHAPPAQPPPATPAGPGFAPAQSGLQASAAPGSAGLIDVPQEEAVIHMAAAGRPTPLSPSGRLAAGATVVTALACGAWLALAAPRRRTALARGDLR